MILAILVILFLAFIAFVAFTAVGVIRGIKAEDAEKKEAESIRKTLPVAEETARGQVISRYAARRTGERDYVCFRLENGRTIWGRFGKEHEDTAVGDHGIVAYCGDSVLRFAREGVLEMKDCPAVFVKKGHSRDGMHSLIFRSDAFAPFGGTLVLLHAGEDGRMPKKGDAGLLSFSGNRMTAFTVTGSGPAEYEGERKISGEPDGPAYGRVVSREVIVSGDDPNDYYVHFLLENGVCAVSESREDYEHFSLGDYGTVWVQNDKFRMFTRQSALEVTDIPAVLTGKKSEKPTKHAAALYTLTFYAGEFEIYGGGLTVTCTAAEYAAYNKGDIGLLSVYGQTLRSFRPGNVGVR